MIREFEHIDLRDRNSFHVAQTAARLVEFETPDELRELFSAGAPRQWYVLGGGNNILFTRDYALQPVCCPKRNALTLILLLL